MGLRVRVFPAEGRRKTPKAMLYAEHIDSVSSAGLFIDDIWYGRRVVTIDLLGDEFINSVKTGDPIAIHEDGTVEVG